MEIEGFGDKTFEQAAGFLRIREGENPLDRTGVHPESYALVEKIAASAGVPVAELIENEQRVNAIDFKALETEAGRYTLADIREELLRPGRDPRAQFVAPQFRDDVREVVDLKEGMELEGRVTNVTNFGAFVDLGVHQDGLVHISELSHKYVQDARVAVHVGDVVKVKVIGVDATMKRISLSMKALQPRPPRPPRRKRPAPPAAAASAPLADASQNAGPLSAPRPDRPDRSQRPDRPPRPDRPAASKSGPAPFRRPEPRAARPDSRPAKPAPAHSPGAPVPASDAPPQTMEEKIRRLQEKFGRVG
jgi:uncharacterized protein